jgi:hypothetical protein
MAYVAIAKTLIGDIEIRINNMRDIELKAEPAPKFPTIRFTQPEWGFLRDEVWGPLVGTTLMFHPELTASSTFTFNFQIEDKEVPGVRVRNSSDYYKDISTEVKDVARHFCATNAGSYRSAAVFRVTRDMHPAFEAWAQWEASRKEIVARWKGIADQVEGFLETCKSLNEALKLWPDLQRYVSGEDMKKVNARAEKPKKDQSAAMARLAAMDLDTIASSTVLARLAAASGDSE